MSYFPFNSVNSDRVYKAEDWARYFAEFISNGVFPTPDNGLLVSTYENMQIQVDPGYGFINGYMFGETDETYLTVSTADGAYDRIDLVVLRWSLEDRMMYLDILQGTTSDDPTAPELTQDTDVWEIALARIDVTAGATEITADMITDLRYDDDMCGICTGLIEQMDFSGFYSQFAAWYAAIQEEADDTYTAFVNSLSTYLASYDSTFAEWFENVKDQLSEDAAGNLQVEIDELEARLSALEAMALTDDFYVPLEVEDDDSDDLTLLTDDLGYAILADWKYEVA